MRSASRARRAAPPELTPMGWSQLLAQAQACCADAEARAEETRDVQMRRMSLTHAVRGAVGAGAFKASGYTAFRAATGFLEIVSAFASVSDPAERAALAPSVRATANFLDNKLHAQRQAAFEAAHRDRPEVQ